MISFLPPPSPFRLLLLYLNSMSTRSPSVAISLNHHHNNTQSQPPSCPLLLLLGQHTTLCYYYVCMHMCIRLTPSNSIGNTVGKGVRSVANTNNSVATEYIAFLVEAVNHYWIILLQHRSCLCDILHNNNGHVLLRERPIREVEHRASAMLSYACV